MMRPGILCGVVLIGSVCLEPAESAASIILYDASDDRLPGEQPWLNYADNTFLPGTSASQTRVAGVGTRLATNGPGFGGYSNLSPLTGQPKNPAFPTLDRHPGFSIGLMLQVHSESHASADRAGFSLTVLSADLLGIELGFWGDRIWAQADSPLFTQAEGVAFDTTAAMTAYDLRISGDRYSLFADGAPILDGLLRDYSSFGLPYSIPNQITLGDNTSRGAADVTLGTIRLSIIPEPSSALLALIAAPAIGLALLRRRPSPPACPPQARVLPQ